MSRLSIKQNVVRKLFALSGNKCAFPECDEILIDEDGSFLGQICHIEAAEEGGERYNPGKTPEHRRSFENLMLLCYKHHVKTNDILKYTVPVMVKMKEDHEAKFSDKQYSLPKEIKDKILNEVIGKLDKIHEQIVGVKSVVQKGNKVGLETNEIAAQSLEMLKKLTSSITISTDDTKIYSEQLTFFKELRKQGKSQTAYDALLKFKSDKWDSFNEELKYKVLANIASMLFDLDKVTLAADHLLELEHVKYKTEDSLAYLCLAYAITGEKKKFEELASVKELKDSENINFWVGYVHMYKGLKSPVEIRDSIPSNVRDKPEILYTLGELFVDEGNSSTGFEMFDKSLAADKNIDKAWHVYGMIATRKLVKITSLEKVAFGGFIEEEKKQIEDCIGLLSKAWDHVCKTELATTSWHLIMNRGIAYKILGDRINAEKDFYDAWRLSQKYITFRNLMLQYLDTDQYEKAEQLLQEGEKKQFEGSNTVEYSTLAARFHSLQKEPEKAVSILKKQAALEVGNEKLHLLDLITMIYFECGAYTKALPYAEQIVKEFSSLPHGYLSVAICYRRAGDDIKSKEYIEICFEKAKANPDQSLIWYQLGMEFSSMKMYPQAAECLEKARIPSVVNEITKSLILAHFYSGNYTRAEELCLEAKEIINFDPTIIEVLFRIYEATADNKKAEEILYNYLEHGLDDAKDHFRLLGIKYFKRKGNEKTTHELLKEIEDAKKFSMLEQFMVSRYLLEFNELEKGLGIAYEVRLNNYEKPEAHQYYITTVVGRSEEKKEEMFPSVVSLENAVELTDMEGEVTTYFITDDTRLNGASYLRSSDPLAKMLVGKELRTQLTMNNSIGIGNTLTITQILNRHVFAFRDSLSLLEKRFAGETGVVVFHGGKEGGIDAMKKFMFEQSVENGKKYEEIFKLYNSGGALTLGMLAMFFQYNMVELWLAMIGSNSTSIIAYMHDESQDFNWSTSKNTSIVLDITALLTIIALLDKANLLNTFTDCVVAQSTIDELREYRQILERGPKTSIVVEDGKLKKTLFSKEDIVTQKVWIDKILLWCKTKARILSPKRAAENQSDSVDVYEMIGQCGYDTLLLAEELEATILSDDEKFKSYALGEHRLRSFSSYQLIAYHANEKKINDKDYSNLCKVLMRANYVLIPVSGKDLWDLYDESGFQIRPPFSRAVRGIRILSKQYAAQTVSIFAKEVYLNISLKEARTYILLHLLNVLKRHNEFVEIKQILLRIIERDFYLMQPHLIDFGSMIRSS